MKLKHLVVGFLSGLWIGGLAVADETIEPTSKLAMPLLQQGGTARGMAMGSAVLSVPQGSASLLWNPAGLSRLTLCPEAGFHYSSGLGNSSNQTIIAGQRFGSLGGFAASLNHVDNGNFQGRDDLGNQTADYSAGDTGGSLGWGRELFSHLSGGLDLKYNRQTLAGASYSAYAADLGLLWNPIVPLNVALAYSNLGNNVADKDLYGGWRLGASYEVRKNLLFAASTEINADRFTRLQAGVEGYVYPSLALRTGFVYNVTNSDLSGLTGWTAGFGLKITKSLTLDYAYVPFGELDTSHYFSLTYKFSCAKDKDTAAAQPAVAVKSATTTVEESFIVLDDTHFKFDEAVLTPAGEKVVQENANVLKENPTVAIVIAGYTSASGTAEYNQILSEKRATAVKQKLIDEGVKADRLTTIGYGKDNPAEFEPIPEHINSPQAHANMRVLFEVKVK